MGDDWGRSMKFKIHKGRWLLGFGIRWRWILEDVNGKEWASSVGFKTRRQCLISMGVLKVVAARAPVVEDGAASEGRLPRPA
jgi:hypothetical protein